MKKWIAILSMLAVAGISKGQTLVDGWYYTDATLGALINTTGCGSVSNATAYWKHSGTPAVVGQIAGDKMQEWTSGGAANESAFKNITPSSGALVGGKCQWSYDIKSADFSITAASNGTMNAAYLIRGKSGSGAYDAGMRLRYEGRLDVTNIVSGVTNVYADADQFQIQVRSSDLSNWTVMTNLTGHTLTDLNFRTVYDLDADTFEAYFTLGAASEVLLHSGTIQSDWSAVQLRQAIQSLNGGNSWQPGDKLFIDNLEFSTLVSAPPPPSTALVDFWDYEGLTNGTLMSKAFSTGYVGNVAFSDATMTGITNLPSGNGVLVFEPTGAANESVFRTASPSLYGGSSTGIYEFAFDVPYMDWSLTQGVDSNANVGFEIRNSANPRDPLTVQVKYIGNGSSDEIRVDYTDASGSATILTIPGAVASNLGVRCVFNLDDGGNAGSAQFYYSLDGVEVAATYTATVNAGLSFGEYRLRAQALNGGNGWQVGDKVFFDNLRVEKISAMPTPPVYSDKVVYQMNDGSGTLLQDLAQTGADGGQFAGTDTNVVANGLGSLKASGIGTNDIYRIHDLDVAYTSGLHRIEFAFDDWNLANSEDSSSLKFGFQDSTGLNNVMLGIDVNTNNGTARFRAAANNGGGSGQVLYGHPGYIASTGVVLRIDVNIDAGIFNAFWRYDNQTDADFVTVAGGKSLGAMSDIAQIRLAMNAGPTVGIDPADYVNTDYLVYSSTSDQLPPTPMQLWNQWLGLYSLGSSTNYSDNPDSDAYDNLAEYYYGGDPSVGGPIGNVPAVGDLVNVSGTNYILYVYTRRQDESARGLSGTIELRDMLPFGAWTNDTSLYQFVGAGNVDATWQAVTNRVNAEAAMRFIRTRVQLTP